MSQVKIQVKCVLVLRKVKIFFDDLYLKYNSLCTRVCRNKAIRITKVTFLVDIKVQTVSMGRRCQS